MKIFKKLKADIPLLQPKIVAKVQFDIQTIIRINANVIILTPNPRFQSRHVWKGIRCCIKLCIRDWAALVVTYCTW